MSRILSWASSKIATWKVPPKLFPLRFKWFKDGRCWIWPEIVPERLRLERSKEVICAVFEWHVTPLHEHQMGSW